MNCIGQSLEMFTKRHANIGRTPEMKNGIAEIYTAREGWIYFAIKRHHVDNSKIKIEHFMTFSLVRNIACCLNRLLHRKVQT